MRWIGVRRKVHVDRLGVIVLIAAADVGIVCGGWG